ncbi:MAG: oligosaccharide flippase family protein [Chitinivibrionales bacterium]|nr:oligosaccharide flippase family protein [Chitinivibrionales bacterium]
MNKYASFAAYLFWGDVAVKLLTFAGQIYCARILGPDGYGLNTIGLALLAYGLLFSDVGIKTIGFIQFSKPQEKRTIEPATIFNVRIVQSLVVLLIFIVITLIMYRDSLLRTICLLYLLNLLYDALFLEWYYKAAQRFKMLTCARLAATVLYVVLLYLFVKNSSQSALVPLLFFCANLVSAVWLLVTLKDRSVRLSWHNAVHHYGGVLKESFPVGLGAIFTQVSLILPPLLLGAWLGPASSGYFGTAIRLVVALMIFDRIFSTLFMSSLPKLWELDRVKTQIAVKHLFHGTLAISSCISLAVSLNAGIIINLIFGPEYEKSAAILSIAIWFVTLTMINSIVAFGLLCISDSKRYLNAAIKSFSINCVILVSSIYFFSEIGAAVSLVVCEIVSLLFFNHEARSYFPLQLPSHLVKTGLILAGTYGINAALPNHPIVQPLISCACFSIFLFAFSIITTNDIHFLVRQWKKN